ncbi:MAG: SDR family NAD(P)-dependent oxidoreductase [Alistipes sp.]|nr:SDR family NAD(P)-dependent oxidoreductase [Candidatus Alistipes equi]
MEIYCLIAAIRAHLNSLSEKKHVLQFFELQEASQCLSLDVENDIEKMLQKIKEYFTTHNQIPGKILLKNFGTLYCSEAKGEGRFYGKVAVITGAAQGLGEAFARKLSKDGAMVVLADRNITGIQKLEEEISNSSKCLSVQTDVTNSKSVEELVEKSVKQFGGIDIFISNAGIVYAGGLDVAKEEEFDRINEVNYKGYFHCAKACSKIMKMQTRYDQNTYADIIQINSKSGLRGSKANFMYSASKFAGIGLTQSFALELAPYRIKVNSICPGNYYEGNLWSDPKNGLFIQYLNAGKVPEAKNVEDVKRHYLSQVPMGKGCSPDDIYRAIVYAIEQTGETGQAIPVTGGQTMLS